jgi:hypothetical protein
LCLRPDVVAVVERHRAALVQCEHCLHMTRHRLHGALDVFIGASSAQSERVSK